MAALVMPAIIMIYSTVPSEDVAKTIIRHLLEKKLIACATMWPCKSMYWWEGAIQNDVEYVILAKTMQENWDAVQKVVAQIHPYQVPCIIKIEAKSNDSYAQWVCDAVSS